MTTRPKHFFDWRPEDDEVTWNVYRYRRDKKKMEWLGQVVCGFAPTAVRLAHERWPKVAKAFENWNRMKRPMIPDGFVVRVAGALGDFSDSYLTNPESREAEVKR